MFFEFYGFQNSTIFQIILTFLKNKEENGFWAIIRYCSRSVSNCCLRLDEKQKSSGVAVNMLKTWFVRLSWIINQILNQLI